jgi:hypothetical protein
MPSIAVRISDSERRALDNLARGDISKYVRSALFGDARRDAQSLQWLENRVNDLFEGQTLLLALVRALDGEVSELRESLAPQPQPVVAPVQDNSRLEGMTLELLLLLRGRAARMDLDRVHAEVERQGLPVWEGSTPPSSFMASNTTERQPQAAVERQDPPGREERSLGSRVKSWLG